MSKKTYQITGDITAHVVSNVNLSDSYNKDPRGPEENGATHYKDKSVGVNPKKSQEKLNNVAKTNGVIWLWLTVLSILTVGALVLFAIQSPRTRFNDNLDFDYIGVIVGILSLLVAFLVAWQIYNTVQAQNDINNFKNEIKSEYKNQIFRLTKRANRLRAQADYDVKKNNARLSFSQAISLMLIADIDMERAILPTDMAKSKERDEETALRTYKFQYCIAYKYFANALFSYITIGSEATSIDSCLSNMERCLTKIKENRENKGTEYFDVKIHNMCDKIYNRLTKACIRFNIDNAIKKRIDNIHKERASIESEDMNNKYGIRFVEEETGYEFYKRAKEIIKKQKEENQQEKTITEAKATTEPDPPTKE